MLFNYQGLEIYYDMQGEGPALLILNGIMMTTKSWDAFLPNIIDKYQLIRLDLIDQGQSAAAHKSYQQDEQVELVEALLSHLGISQVNVFGISYGGEVALQYALKYPKRIAKLILSNTCAQTNYWLEEIGKSWKAAMTSGLSFYLATIPIIYSPQFFVAKQEWMQARKATLTELFNQAAYLARMERLINSAEGYDVRDRLGELQMETYILGSSLDGVTPLQQQIELQQQIKNAYLTIIPEAGHAVMYEKPQEFLAFLLGALQIQHNIEI